MGSFNGDGPATSPETAALFRRVAIGFGISAAGAVLRLAATTGILSAIAIALGIAGLIFASSALIRRPADSRLLACIAAIALMALFSANPNWGAVRMLFGVLAAVATVAALVMLLPKIGRRIVVSALVLFHFVGVLSAITSPPPQPWLTGQLWVRIFRPHLEFCYTNNAYQFYSPEPGPANILWICVNETGGKQQWLKVPGKNENYDPLGVEYYRRLSITERANGNEQLASPPVDMYLRRIELKNDYPFEPDLVEGMQFRMPNEDSRQFLMDYARHVAAVYRSEHPGADVKSMKIYLTLHRLLKPEQYAEHVNPYDKASYLPFFVGEYSADGVLLNPFDPMLYWIVPIIKKPKLDPATHQPIPNQYEYVNYVTFHAGSDPFSTPEESQGRSNEQ